MRTVGSKRKASSLSSKWASVKKARVARDKRKGISTLGRIAGKVAPSQTTLSRAIGPFAERKMVTFEYKNAATTVGSANLLQLSVLLNSVYDFDKSSGNYFGNKQPLYYDQLLAPVDLIRIIRSLVE